MSVDDFELVLPHYNPILVTTSDWRKGIEYLGYLIGKTVPKEMSLRRALRTMLPFLFGLQSGLVSYTHIY